MKYATLGAIVIAALLVACSRVSGDTEKSSKGPGIKEPGPKEVIMLKVDVEEEKRLQQEVDKGHQPWRLETISVALAAVASIDESVDESKCTEVGRGESEASVLCNGKARYLVKLKRIVRSDGIWTAESIERD